MMKWITTKHMLHRPVYMWKFCMWFIAMSEHLRLFVDIHQLDEIDDLEKYKALKEKLKIENILS